MKDANERSLLPDNSVELELDAGEDNKVSIELSDHMENEIEVINIDPRLDAIPNEGDDEDDIYEENEQGKIRKRHKGTHRPPSIPVAAWKEICKNKKTRDEIVELYNKQKASQGTLGLSCSCRKCAKTAVLSTESCEMGGNSAKICSFNREKGENLENTGENRGPPWSSDQDPGSVSIHGPPGSLSHVLTARPKEPTLLSNIPANTLKNEGDSAKTLKNEGNSAKTIKNEANPAEIPKKEGKRRKSLYISRNLVEFCSAKSSHLGAKRHQKDGCTYCREDY